MPERMALEQNAMNAINGTVMNPNIANGIYPQASAIIIALQGNDEGLII